MATSVSTNHREQGDHGDESLATQCIPTGPDALAAVTAVMTAVMTAAVTATVTSHGQRMRRHRAKV